MVWSSLALEGMEISVGGGFVAAATEKCMCWKKLRGTRIPRKRIDSPPSNNQNTGMARDTRGMAWEEIAWIPVIGNDLSEKMTHKRKKMGVINVMALSKCSAKKK
jgi:hypothetical protein